MVDPCVLIILDGWGIGTGKIGNAVTQANTPVLDGLFERYPHTRLSCSGEAVGLPPGIMGNSEVGHLNIGAGRVVFQDLLRIDKAIADGSFFRNEALGAAMAETRKRGSVLHLMGLVSDGGVHSQLTHLFALLEMARDTGVKSACVHAILDGRDTPPHGGADYVARLQEHMRGLDYGRIASICGRYYAMDRDKRWQRVEKAYRLYTRGEGVHETDPVAAVKKAYARGETDEFVEPIVITDARRTPVGTLQDGDAVVFFNFRADRAREITRAFTAADFDGFVRTDAPRPGSYVCMTVYDETFNLPVAFPPVRLEEILGEVVSRHGLEQLRIAETEKYAHVTYFFNGGEETPFPGEDRCLIPSPREVPTYDHKPEMSAPQVTDEVVKRIASDRYALIVLNFANMDMVGHTGVLAAAIKACETVDRCLGRILTELKTKGCPAVVTADHGNAEMMIDAGGATHTAHTTNQVPLVLADESRRQAALREGVLADIAPTLLEIMGLPQPSKMTGKSLIVRQSKRP